MCTRMPRKPGADHSWFGSWLRLKSFRTSYYFQLECNDELIVLLITAQQHEHNGWFMSQKEV